MYEANPLRNTQRVALVVRYNAYTTLFQEHLEKAETKRAYLSSLKQENSKLTYEQLACVDIIPILESDIIRDSSTNASWLESPFPPLFDEEGNVIEIEN